MQQQQVDEPFFFYSCGDFNVALSRPRHTWAATAKHTYTRGRRSVGGRA